MKDIPEYDPVAEGRKRSRTGTDNTTGYWIGQGSRKRLIIPEHVWKLAAIGCTDREIAQWYDCAEPTLKENFGVYMARARADMRQRLRRAQFQHAINGNATLLIWLGKQILGQSDNPTDAADSQVLPWTEKDMENSDE